MAGSRPYPKDEEKAVQESNRRHEAVQKATEQGNRQWEQLWGVPTSPMGEKPTCTTCGAEYGPKGHKAH